MISFLEDINYQKSNFVEKKPAFCPIKIFCEKRDGHSKRERKKIIALHLKRVFLQDDITKKTTSPSFLRADSQRGTAELTIARRKRGRVV